jgi:hypothetical protein
MAAKQSITMDLKESIEKRQVSSRRDKMFTLAGELHIKSCAPEGAKEIE